MQWPSEELGRPGLKSHSKQQLGRRGLFKFLIQEKKIITQFAIKIF